MRGNVEAEEHARKIGCVCCYCKSNTSSAGKYILSGATYYANQCFYVLFALLCCFGGTRGAQHVSATRPHCSAHIERGQGSDASFRQTLAQGYQLPAKLNNGLSTRQRNRQRSSPGPKRYSKDFSSCLSWFCLFLPGPRGMM